MQTYPVQPRACPECDNPISRVTNVDGGRGPEPFDCMVCNECGALLTFDEDMKFRHLLASELEAMVPEERAAILRDQRAIRAANPLRRGRRWEFG